MNRHFFYLIVSFLLVFMSCQKDDFDSKLRGKWQLKTVEQAGVITEVDTVWYNFQSESLFMYQIYYAQKDSFMYRYGYVTYPEESVLNLEINAYSGPVDAFLPYTDWSEPKRTFRVDKLSSKHFVLQDEGKIYSFKKFE